MERFAFLLQCTKIAVEGVDLYPFAPIKKRHFGTIPLKSTRTNFHGVVFKNIRRFSRI